MNIANIYTPSSARIWMQLVEDDRCEFFLEEVGDVDEIGTPPQWLTEEKSNVGIEDMMSFERRSAESGLGWSFSETMLHWALERGIMPEVPFLVEIEEPLWTGPDYYGECDVDYYADIVYIPPFDPVAAADYWANFLERLQRYRRDARAEMRLLKMRRIEDVGAMYTSSFVYGREWQPSGICIQLNSRHTNVLGFHFGNQNSLGEGRDDEGDHEKAWAALYEKVKDLNPLLTLEFIKALPRNRR